MTAHNPDRSGPVGVGVIGAGNISDTYLENLSSFADVEVHIIGDLDIDRAHTQAIKHSVPASGSATDVLVHPAVEIIVNLTVPAVHAEISSAIIAARKHVWSEKPIAIDRPSAKKLLLDAAAAGLRVGVAPDTVLGPGVQSARRAIERGDIGQPLFAHTTMQSQGPEIFHPNPAFLFAEGAGPLLDIGPYYFTTLAHIFGPITGVAAMAISPRSTRTVLVGEKKGQSFPVEVASTIDVLAHFAGGQQSHSLFSTDSPLLREGIVEITGTEGTISVPDPNKFSGSSAIVRPRKYESQSQTWTQQRDDGTVVGRGLGLLEMARAIRAGTPHRASGELAYHVLDAMLAAQESATSHQFVEVTSAFNLPSTMPVEFDPYGRTL